MLRMQFGQWAIMDGVAENLASGRRCRTNELQPQMLLLETSCLDIFSLNIRREKLPIRKKDLSISCRILRL